MGQQREENTQREECCRRFGKNIGKLLYRAMNRIAWLGFEVSPTDACDRVLVTDPSSRIKGQFTLAGDCLEYIVVGPSMLHLPDEVRLSKIRRYMTPYED